MRAEKVYTGWRRPGVKVSTQVPVPAGGLMTLERRDRD